MTLPTIAELNAYDMHPIMAQFKQVPEIQFINEPAGQNHYRLLRWVSHNYGPAIIELGTYMGLATACLAHNQNNHVFTYDTTFASYHLKRGISNISKLNAPDVEYFDPLIKGGNVIFVDTWHEGKMERAVYDYLVSEKWKGILIFDDIYYSDAMRKFWEGINHSGKIDVTHLGHVTGTGFIDFTGLG